MCRSYGHHNELPRGLISAHTYYTPSLFCFIKKKKLMLSLLYPDMQCRKVVFTEQSKLNRFKRRHVCTEHSPLTSMPHPTAVKVGIYRTRVEGHMRAWHEWKITCVHGVQPRTKVKRTHTHTHTHDASSEAYNITPIASTRTTNHQRHFCTLQLTIQDTVLLRYYNTRTQTYHATKQRVRARANEDSPSASPS